MKFRVTVECYGDEVGGLQVSKEVTLEQMQQATVPMMPLHVAFSNCLSSLLADERVKAVLK